MRAATQFRMTRFGKLADFWIPKAQILHPHPNQRFDAKHPT